MGLESLFIMTFSSKTMLWESFLRFRQNIQVVWGEIKDNRMQVTARSWYERVKDWLSRRNLFVKKNL